MGSKIKYLLKFQKKEYLKDLVDGHQLFVNMSGVYRDMEKERGIKGQGDSLDAMVNIFSRALTISIPGTDQSTSITFPMTLTGGFDSVSRIPMYCLYAVHEEDCVLDESGQYKIKMTEKAINSIKTQFPDANAVALIDDPEQFLKDIDTSLPGRIIHDEVQYFKLAEGFRGEDGKPVMDLDYISFLTQTSYEGEEKIVVDMSKIDPTRTLFAKDEFFKR